MSWAEILDLLRMLWLIMLDRLVTTQGANKSILYVKLWPNDRSISTQFLRAFGRLDATCWVLFAQI